MKEKNILNNKFQISDDLIFGRNAVMEAIKSNRTINKVMVSIGAQGSIKAIVSNARKKKIIVQEVSISVLNKITNNQNHQGIVAMISPFSYSSVDDILEEAKRKNEKTFIIITDGITDPHNLGALMRTAECVGAHGIIIPKRNSVPVNSTVVKVAAGAAEHMMVARENNIVQVIEYLKMKDVWIFGADEDSDKLIYDVNLNENIAIVIGGEDTGIRKLVMNNCDTIAKIPMKGRITSLNASVAGAIMMYEVLRQRLKLG